MEMVHVGRPVRIDACQQGRDARQLGKIRQRDGDAGRGRNRRDVQGVVGRSAGRHQTDNAVHDGARIHHLSRRPVVLALRRDRRRPVRSRLGQRGPQRRAGIGKCRARQVQAHHFHQHLVGVRRTIEGAGALAVIALGFSLQQRLTADFAFRKQLPHPDLFGIRKSRRHRPRRHEDGRQPAKAQRGNHKTRHDLVAHAEMQRRIERVVRQADRRRHRDHVTREQRQLHAFLALCDAVAHRRHAARHLRNRMHLARGLADQLRIGFKRRVRRQHVVVSRDDPDDRPAGAEDLRLLNHRATGGLVREVSLRQPRPRVGGGAP